MSRSAGDLSGLPLSDLIERVNAAEGGPGAKAELYKRWILFNPTDPSLFGAFFNYGVVLGDGGDLPGAVIALREAIRLRPDFVPARIGIGLLHEKLGQNAEAVQSWLGVVDSLGAITREAFDQKITALENTGRLLETLERDEAAEDCLRQRLELASDGKVIQHFIALRMRQAKWPVLVTPAIGRDKLIEAVSPLSLACLVDDPCLQLATAARYARDLPGPAAAPEPKSQPEPAFTMAATGRLRIGYVSSDLREHAVGFAMGEVFELHDRRRCEIFAYYCGIKRDDPTKARLAGAVDHWLDIADLSDAAAAASIRADGIDILVDLNGYTRDARTAVFALRPAPINVNWFGFPSTMGTPFHHYIIADEQIIPQGSEVFYSERVVRLPCYQPNDRKRRVAAAPTRAGEGLPEDGFVFCSFNGLQKITPVTFSCWLRILAAVPDSVLWLLGGTGATQDRLRAFAARHGIEPGRLVFAARKANPEHVARYALADLFLDNWPYGAHTTASDALWMGVPIVTLPGHGFASRVCSSLLKAAGVGELICADAGDYERKAIHLATHRGEVRALKAFLAGQRGGCRLFDMEGLTRSLEGAYGDMADDYRRGRLPRPGVPFADDLFERGKQLVLGDRAFNRDAYRGWLDRET